MSKGSSDPMQGLVANGRVEDVPDEGMQNYADAPAQGDGGGIGNKVVDNTAKLGNTFLDGLKSLGAMFAGPAAAMSTAASKVTGAVGRTLNIGQGASKVVSLALVAALAGTGAVGVASVIGNDDITTIYVGTDDCKKAMDDAKRQYGFGERDIPEMVGDLTVDRSHGGFGSPYAVMMGRAGGINANLGTEDRQVAMNAIGYANGQDQSVFYRSAGDYPHGQDSPMGSYSPFYYHDEDGFCRLGEYYILGVQPAGFGRTETEAANVGDWITFYFEDGQSFDTILVDTKGSASGPGYDFLNGTPMDTIVSLPDPQGLGRPNNVCGWGHCYDGTVNVFEFWSSTNYVTANLGGGNYDGKSLPKDMDPIKLIAKSLDEPEGAPVVSFTNHGIAPEVQAVAEQFGMTDSLLGVALETQGAARANGMDKVADECKRDCPKTYDNSGIAEAAMSMSYSNMSGSGKPGTELYLEVMKKCDVSEPSMSCDRGVCTSVRWAGADDEYPVGITDDQLEHVEASDKWEEVTDYVPGSGKYDMLQPGDVWVQHGGVNGHEHGHTSIYVGEELLKEHQFEGDADVGPVPEGAFSCSASLGDRALCVGMDDASSIDAKAFRCIEYEKDSKYADGSIDSGASVAASTGCNGSNKKSSEKRKINGLNASTKLDGFVVPLKPGTYTVSCEWGDTSIAQHATGHSGIDLAASSGTEIAAAGPGTVSHVGYDPDGGMGNNVWIQHSNGMMTIYMHMSKHRAGIKVGDRVDAGDLIGYVGTTGDSTGPHLHFQVCSDYNYSNNVNPRDYFDF